MAKVLVTNIREHAIHINVPSQAADGKKPFIPTEHVVVPAAKPVGDSGELAHGTLLVEQEHLERAKAHPVIQHYFKEGWLRINKSESKPPVDDK